MLVFSSRPARKSIEWSVSVHFFSHDCRFHSAVCISVHSNWFLLSVGFHFQRYASPPSLGPCFLHLLLVWSSVTLLLLFAIPLFRLVPAFPTLPPQFNWQRWLFLPSIPLQVSWSIYPAALFCFSPYPSLANVRSDGQELVALKVSYSSLSAVVVFHWIYRVCARMYLCIRSILFRHSGGILSWFAVSLIIKLLSNKSKEFSPCMCRIILQFSFNFVPHFPLRLSVRLSVYTSVCLTMKFQIDVS